MQLLIQKCSQCDCGQQRPIVNKRYNLCDQKNYERIHGQTKEAVYSERAAARQAANPTPKVRFRSKEVAPVAELKQRYSIKAVSDKGKAHCSDGSVVNQIFINRKYTETIDQLKHERPAMCQGQERWDVPLSFSHTISRKRCKDLGKSELIWDKDNLEIEGYHEPSSIPEYAHNIWETGSIHKKVKLLNIVRKLKYIKEHDPESFRIWLCDLQHEGYHKLIEEISG